MWTLPGSGDPAHGSVCPGVRTCAPHDDLTQALEVTKEVCAILKPNPLRGWDVHAFGALLQLDRRHDIKYFTLPFVLHQGPGP